LLSSLLLAIPRPPLPPPSPYTTLFRSQIAHAHRAKLLADHSVTGAEIEDSQRRGGHVVALQLFLQQLADDVGGTAIENVVEQLFVETGDGEDAVVVVEPDLLPGTVEQQ